MEQSRAEKKKNLGDNFSQLYSGLGDFSKFLHSNHPRRSPFLDSVESDQETRPESKPLFELENPCFTRASSFKWSREQLHINGGVH